MNVMSLDDSLSIIIYNSLILTRVIFVDGGKYKKPANFVKVIFEKITCQLHGMCFIFCLI
jgi:hypothetical protein